MPAFISLVGEKFGMLTVLSRAPNKGGLVVWNCRCDCGSEILVLATRLLRGAKTTCGCTPAGLRHGFSKHPLYTTWNLMMARCYNQNHDAYYRYGGRGIIVQDSWHDCTIFLPEIEAHLGAKPGKDYQLDRVNNNGNYCVGNVRWSTRTENCRNRRDNVMIMYKGELQTMRLVSELTGIGYGTLYTRRKLGWPPEKMFNEPKR